MKSSEQAIEKVMAGLREASASPGMERRILKAVEVRISARSRSGWRRVWPMGFAGASARRPFAWGIALAGVLAAAVVIPSTYRMGHAPAPSGVTPTGVVFQASAASGPIPRGPQISVPGSGPRSARKPVRTRTRLDRDTSSAAPQEARVVSYPAPPMPLTEQERLLLRIVHAGDPVELAMLNPEVRAKREAEDEAEFHRFFPPPATVDNE